jgi:hypothetical protein
MVVADLLHPIDGLAIERLNDGADEQGSSVGHATRRRSLLLTVAAAPKRSATPPTKLAEIDQ